MLRRIYLKAQRSAPLIPQATVRPGSHLSTLSSHLSTLISHLSTLSPQLSNFSSHLSTLNSQEISWYPHWESNPDRLFRKQLFYPLNYRDF